MQAERDPQRGALAEEPRVEDPLALLADELLDSWLPGELRWRPLVERYPMGTLLAAAGLGAWLGWRHGRRLVQAAGDLLAAGIEERLAGLLPEGEEP